MKAIIVSLFLVLPISAVAQNYQMPSGDMQKMMMEMQQCMAKVDQSQLQQLEQEAKKMEQEIKGLCSQGKRDKAEKVAIKYGMEMKDKPVLKQMQKCAELAKGMMPEGMMPGAELNYDATDGHICDNMN